MTRPPRAPRSCARARARRCGAAGPSSGDAGSPTVTARSPITGEELFAVGAVDRDGVLGAIAAAREAFEAWRTVPAPVRGALVKRSAGC